MVQRSDLQASVAKHYARRSDQISSEYRIWLRYPFIWLASTVLLLRHWHLPYSSSEPVLRNLRSGHYCHWQVMILWKSDEVPWYSWTRLKVAFYANRQQRIACATRISLDCDLLIGDSWFAATVPCAVLGASSISSQCNQLSAALSAGDVSLPVPSSI